MLETLREFNIYSVCARLLLAAIAGGVLGLGRGMKKQTAGLRTYLITCVGSALTALIGFYEYQMLAGDWAHNPLLSDIKFDGSRFSASVISGIGFLAAGSIMLIKHQQVSGLTTAIGLFVTACVGIAAGAGFYEVVIIAVVFIVFVMELMYTLELAFKRKMRNMTVHVDFDDLENISVITDALNDEGATVYEFELEETKRDKTNPSAILGIKLSKTNTSHSSILSSVAECPAFYPCRN